MISNEMNNNNREGPAKTRMPITLNAMMFAGDQSESSFFFSFLMLIPSRSSARCSTGTGLPSSEILVGLIIPSLPTKQQHCVRTAGCSLPIFMCSELLPFTDRICWQNVGPNSYCHHHYSSNFLLDSNNEYGAQLILKYLSVVGQILQKININRRANGTVSIQTTQSQMSDTVALRDNTATNLRRVTDITTSVQ